MFHIIQGKIMSCSLSFCWYLLKWRLNAADRRAFADLPFYIIKDLKRGASWNERNKSPNDTIVPNGIAGIEEYGQQLCVLRMKPIQKVMRSRSLTVFPVKQNKSYLVKKED
jgi:hypothetical protein